MMSSDQVLNLLNELQGAGVSAWIDGGWGVDALLRRQTREHDDLDLVIPTTAVETCRSLLEDNGFVVERDWLPTALALRHADGRAVDFHLIEPTADGGGDQIQRDGVTRWHYSSPVTGVIAGHEVRCSSAECQLEAHLGYEPDDDDRADMCHLAKAFGIQLPAPYR